MNLNTLYLKVYYGVTSTAAIPDIDRAIEKSTIESLTTAYPGGLYAAMRVLVPRSPIGGWAVKAGYRIVAYNGFVAVWEGTINEIGAAMLNGVFVTVLDCVGQWATLMEKRSWEKIWADNRIDEQTWVRQAVGDNDGYANIERSERISIGPQTIAWTTNEVVASFRYTMPTGETVKYWKCRSKNKPNTWKTRGYDSVGATELWTNVSAGLEEDEAVTLGTPRQYVDFQFLSAANQTPTGATYGRMYEVLIYSETGGITANSIVKNVRAHNTDINSDETHISANTLSLEPFATEGRQPLSDILQKMCSYGDSSNNPWAAYLIASDVATTPNGKPVLVYEAQPLLTDYDLIVNLGDRNVTGNPEFKFDLSEVYNWVSVKYRNVSGKETVVTPDDDATLKDATSIALYGERHLPEVIDAGVATATTAKNIAKRVLAFKKSTKYLATRPIEIQGWVKMKSGTTLPACRIHAGQRIQIMNSLNETPFLITQTSYNPRTQTNALTMGVPDRLSVYLARQELANRTRRF